jgi:hypothetical protein
MLGSQPAVDAGSWLRQACPVRLIDREKESGGRSEKETRGNKAESGGNGRCPVRESGATRCIARRERGREREGEGRMETEKEGGREGRRREADVQGGRESRVSERGGAYQAAGLLEGDAVVAEGRLLPLPSNTHHLPKPGPILSGLLARAARSKFLVKVAVPGGSPGP